MMDRCLDTTKQSRQQLQEYARQLLLFVNQYEWITHAYVVVGLFLGGGVGEGWWIDA